MKNIGKNIGGGFCIGYPPAPGEAVKDLPFDCIQFGISLDIEALDDPQLTVSFTDSYQLAGPSLAASSRQFDDSYNN